MKLLIERESLCNFDALSVIENLKINDKLSIIKKPYDTLKSTIDTCITAIVNNWAKNNNYSITEKYGKFKSTVELSDKFIRDLYSTIVKSLQHLIGTKLLSNITIVKPRYDHYTFEFEIAYSFNLDKNYKTFSKAIMKKFNQFLSELFPATYTKKTKTLSPTDSKQRGGWLIMVSSLFTLKNYTNDYYIEIEAELLFVTKTRSAKATITIMIHQNSVDYIILDDHQGNQHFQDDFKINRSSFKELITRLLNDFIINW